MKCSLILLVALGLLVACGDDEASSNGSSNGGAAAGGESPTGGAPQGGSNPGGSNPGGSGVGGVPVDTWGNFAGDFFGTYCAMCHPGAQAIRDYTTFQGVVPDIAEIRCGVTPTALADCNGFPPPAQFPIAGGTPLTDDAIRQRLVDWIDAGFPE
jgi:hypothetical protein